MYGGDRDQERDAVPRLDGFTPPCDICEEITREDCGLLERSRETFGSQTSVEEQPPRKRPPGPQIAMFLEGKELETGQE